jgi:GNAT superfamily N-acetyltransferase
MASPASPARLTLRDHTADPRPVLRTLLQLRPVPATREALLERLQVTIERNDEVVLGVHRDGEEDAIGVATYKIVHNVAYGRVLYVDDLVTDADARRLGVGGFLMDELERRRDELGCDELQLDSAPTPERAAAHAMYFRRGMRITCFHFGP